MDRSFRLVLVILGLTASVSSGENIGRSLQETGDTSESSNDMANYKCAFRAPPKELRDQYEVEITEYIEAIPDVVRDHKGKDDDNDDDDEEVVALIKIPTWWHNIETTDGFDGVTLEQIEANMVVLNDSFESAGFYFELVGVTNTMNSDYQSYSIDFENIVPDGITTPVQSEARMKTELKEGGCGTLNIYSNEPFFLGFTVTGDATVPFFCQGADTTMDGVIVNRNAVTGGQFVGLNQGKVLVHEVGHW